MILAPKPKNFWHQNQKLIRKFITYRGTGLNCRSDSFEDLPAWFFVSARANQDEIGIGG